MDVGTVFKFSLYGLTAFVGLILGIAEGEGAISGSTRAELFLPYGSIPVVICGFLVTERPKRPGNQGGSGLSAIWANSFGMIALVATAYEFTRENRESKLLAGTHLLLYATWIVLFQQKTIRSYWFLMALGILQLSIASVLTRSEWFGFAAVVYLFAAVWTLSIFSLWRAEQLFEEENRNGDTNDITALDGASNPPNQARRRLTSDVRGTIQHEGGTHWLTSRFVSGVMTTALAALIVSTAFFAFIPRVWVGSDFAFQEDLDRLAGINRKTGFATTVKLGDLSFTLESAEKVFEIQIMRRSTGEKIPVQKYAETLGLAEPLFRGGIMTNYENGNWTIDRTLDYLVPGFPIRRNRLALEDIIQQDVHVEKAESGPLFCLGRPLVAFFGKQQTAGGYLDSTGIAMRGENSANDYTVLTRIPPQQRLQFRLPVQPETVAQYTVTNYLSTNTKLPDGLTRLSQLAREIVEMETTRRNKAEQRTQFRELTPLEKATALEYYLRDSKQYSYSLDSSVIDPKIDPVEDFLFNRKTGHCEYFATALTLMIRAVGVPARVVSGYKGGIEHGDSDSPGRKMYSFEVQKRYAHLWSEAWVDPDDEGAWTTFDATPADGRSSSIAELASKKASMWSDMTTRFSTLWSDSILNLSLERQEESIYKPLREFGLSVASFAYNVFASPESVLESLWTLLQNRQQWLSIRGGLLAFAILTVLSLLAWFIKKLNSWFSMRSLWKRQQRHRVVKFYERFQMLMKRYGMSRKPTQTQQEFAQAVISEFRPLLDENRLADTPSVISTFFYRVRFGEEELSNSELAEMEEILSTFELALTDSQRAGSNRSVRT